MYELKRINADHKDIIHDVAYDFYGKRLATCSSDQSVKVWDLGEDGDWHCTANWKTHSGSVWKVTWAHPEFGQVLATCSFDRTASVWEELVDDSVNERNQSHWVKRTSLVDSRTSVTDVRFAPKHLGLQLATCSADGIVRIYEAPDVMNLSQWSLQHEINCKLPCSCVAWNPSTCRRHPSMIAVGSDDQNVSVGGKVLLYEYSNNNTRWVRVETLTIMDPVHDLLFAPNLGRSYHILAVASKDVQIITLKPLQPDPNAISAQGVNSKFEIRQAGQFDDHNSQVWRVCWNVTGTLLASAGDDGCVRLWKGNYLENWKCVATLKGDGTSIIGDKNSSSLSTGQSVGSAGSIAGLNQTRYYKLGQISHPGQVPWH